MYKVKNISGGQLVCTLADKVTTLRVDNKATEEVADELMTDYIRSLEKKKLVKLTHTADPKTNTKTTAPTTGGEKEG